MLREKATVHITFKTMGKDDPVIGTLAPATYRFTREVKGMIKDLAQTENKKLTEYVREMIIYFAGEEWKRGREHVNRALRRIADREGGRKLEGYLTEKFLRLYQEKFMNFR